MRASFPPAYARRHRSRHGVGSGRLLHGRYRPYENNFEPPEWVSVFDSRPAVEVAISEALIEKSTGDDKLIIVFHVPAGG